MSQFRQGVTADGRRGDDFTAPCSLLNDYWPGVDESGSPLALVIIDTPTRDTVNRKFGTGSALFGLTFDPCIQIVNSAALNLTNQDFTIEFWTRLAAEPAAIGYWLSRYGPGGTRSWNVNYDRSGNRIVFTYSLDGTSTATAAYDLDIDGVSLASFFDNTFHHVAIVRSAGVVRVFVDGTVGSITSAIGTGSIASPAVPLYIGAAATANLTPVQPWPGNMDEIRITIGLGRYGGGFTPPAAEFGRNVTGDANFALVKLLLGFNEQFAITQGGTVTALPVVTDFSNEGPIDLHGMRTAVGLTGTYFVPNTEFDFGAGDFSIEAYGVRCVGAAWSGIQTLLGCWSHLPVQRAWRIGFDTTNFVFQYTLDGTTIITLTFAAGAAADTAYDFAVCRKGNDIFIFKDGVRTLFHNIGGASIFAPTSISLPLGVLAGLSSGLANTHQAVAGTRIRSFRVTKGRARFVGLSYAVPVLPLPLP